MSFLKKNGKWTLELCWKATGGPGSRGPCHHSQIRPCVSNQELGHEGSQCTIHREASPAPQNLTSPPLTLTPSYPIISFTAHINFWNYLGYCLLPSPSPSNVNSIKMGTLSVLVTIVSYLLTQHVAYVEGGEEGREGEREERRKEGREGWRKGRKGHLNKQSLISCLRCHPSKPHCTH